MVRRDGQFHVENWPIFNRDCRFRRFYSVYKIHRDYRPSTYVWTLWMDFGIVGIKFEWLKWVPDRLNQLQSGQSQKLWKNVSSVTRIYRPGRPFLLKSHKNRPGTAGLPAGSLLTLLCFHMCNCSWGGPRVEKMPGASFEFSSENRHVGEKSCDFQWFLLQNVMFWHNFYLPEFPSGHQFSGIGFPEVKRPWMSDPWIEETQIGRFMFWVS